MSILGFHLVCKIHRSVGPNTLFVLSIVASFIKQFLFE